MSSCASNRRAGSAASLDLDGIVQNAAARRPCLRDNVTETNTVGGASTASDPIARLLALESLGIKVGLENISALVDALGHPERSYRSVIVAGTNGKGSVSAMVEAGLRRAGHRTGLYTSPHLVDVAERFVVDGDPVDRRELAVVASDLLETASALTQQTEGRIAPTFFETTTALAFELFRRRRVEIAVLEVGLGGRFDATNIVTPAACAITSIALDHERFLGHTIDEIAFEKAGVIKPGVPVVVGSLPARAMAVVERVAGERRAPLLIAEEDVELDASMADGETWMQVTTPRCAYARVHLALRGRHQVGNAVVATRLLEGLNDAGVRVPPAAVEAALRETRWRGRLEWIDVGSRRRLLLDAAHNPEGARTLAAYLGEVIPEGLPIVFGAMRDKDTAGMLAALLPHTTHLITTRASTPRSQDPHVLTARATAMAPGLVVQTTQNVLAALEAAGAAGGRVCVAGSIFVVGEVIAALGDAGSRG